MDLESSLEFREKRGDGACGPRKYRQRAMTAPNYLGNGGLTDEAQGALRCRCKK